MDLKTLINELFPQLQEWGIFNTFTFEYRQPIVGPIGETGCFGPRDSNQTARVPESAITMTTQESLSTKLKREVDEQMMAVWKKYYEAKEKQTRILKAYQVVLKVNSDEEMNKYHDAIQKYVNDHPNEVITVQNSVWSWNYQTQKVKPECQAEFDALQERNKQLEQRTTDMWNSFVTTCKNANFNPTLELWSCEDDDWYVEPIDNLKNFKVNFRCQYEKPNPDWFVVEKRFNGGYTVTFHEECYLMKPTTQTNDSNCNIA